MASINHTRAGTLYDLWKATHSLESYVRAVEATPFLADLDAGEVRATWFAFEASASTGLRTGDGEQK